MNECPPSPKKTFADAADEFDPTPETIKILSPYKDKIGELRRKGASYVRISRMLENDGIQLSRMTISRFCQRVLGRENRKKGSAKIWLPDERPASLAKQTSPASSLMAANPAQIQPAGPEAMPAKKRGPRIADSKNL